MKILYCVQRYGEEIAGGAEAACRQIAERMSARGHEVEVLTTCALDYNTWADHYPEGVSQLGGVTVNRLPVRAPRRTDRFWPLHRRVTDGPAAALGVQHDWLRVLGPDVPSVSQWCARNAGRFDVAVCFTYLYATTGLAIRRLAEDLPVLLVPTAHDEPAFWLEVFRPEFDAASAVAFLTPEEEQLARRRGMRVRSSAVMGLGVEVSNGDGSRFRRRYGIDAGEQVVVYLGRLDPGKGPDELFRYMSHLWEHGRTSARLVVVGQPVIELPAHPLLTVTGFVDEETKADALAAATVFVQPSYFESFSLSLCEAWMQGRPALVQRRCEVLAGQIRRCAGGLGYSSLAEFEAGLARLLDDAELRQRLGAAGRRHVRDQYGWVQVLDRHEAQLRSLVPDTDEATRPVVVDRAGRR